MLAKKSSTLVGQFDQLTAVAGIPSRDQPVIDGVFPDLEPGTGQSLRYGGD